MVTELSPGTGLHVCVSVCVCTLRLRPLPRSDSDELSSLEMNSRLLKLSFPAGLSFSLSLPAPDFFFFYTTGPPTATLHSSHGCCCPTSMQPHTLGSCCLSLVMYSQGSCCTTSCVFEVYPVMQPVVSVLSGCLTLYR